MLIASGKGTRFDPEHGRPMKARWRFPPWLRADVPTALEVVADYWDFERCVPQCGPIIGESSPLTAETEIRRQRTSPTLLCLYLKSLSEPELRVGVRV